MGSFLGMSLNDLIQLRIFRGDENISLDTFTDDWNKPVIGFLENHPKFLITGVGLGNIHFWALDYIPEEYMHFMGGNVFCAKSGFLRVLSELGVLGVGLFFYAFFKPFLYFKKYSPKIKIHFLLSFLIFLNFLLTMTGPIYITFAFIIVYTLYNNNKLTNRKQISVP